MDEEAFIAIAAALPAFVECATSSSAMKYLAHLIGNSDSRNHEDDAVVALIADDQRLNSHKRKKAKMNISIIDLIPKFDDKQFKTHFHLNRSTVEFLMTVIGPELNDDGVVRPGRRKLGGEIALLLPISIISSRESFRSNCRRFGVSDGHGYRMFTNFCNALADKVKDFITWPTGIELNKNLIRFENMITNGLPGVLGCIGGSYIPIRGLKSEKESFCVRKQFRAIILQGICNCENAFIDIFLSWPGHDSTVWEDSPIYEQLTTDVENYLPDDTYIIGNRTYPLNDFLMVPYPDDGYLSSKEEYFNQQLNSSKTVIENAFGMLKTRFKKLKFLDMIRKELATRVIITACILHNICIQKEDFLEEIEADENQIENIIADDLGDGQAKRSRIAETLYLNKF